MDKTSGSSFRATPAADGTPQNQDCASGSGAAGKPPGELCVPRPQIVKLRVLPPGAGEAEPARAMDWKSVLKGALATMTGQGLCFGTAVGTMNHLRHRSKTYPKLNYVVAGLLPPLTGYATAPMQATMYKALDYKSTQMPQESLLHDAIPSATLLAVYRGYAVLSFVPRPAPGTPAAAGVSLMLSLIGTGLAGAATEATAQWAGGQPAPHPDDEEVHHKGLGRAICLAPMGVGSMKAVSYVLRLGKVPKERQGDVLNLALWGWIWRNTVSAELKALQSSPSISTTPPTSEGAAPHEPPPGHDT